ncbi:MAG TPA: hypothetical protein PLO37_08965 [Candidatus Hydrogenedentes bacterium]|nr:hypothetical protein [Candidatus Hydrogenedentota bacterium]HPG66965.1 hypothetical protein [Candidatus Hydrogenedentota bacterium]
MWKCLIASSVLIVSVRASAAVVTAAPAKVTFTSPNQSEVVLLTKDGAPVPAAAIQGWRFIASGHDYRHMLTLEKADGAITIAPSAALEVGSYALDIDTAQGPVTVHVLAPLSDLPDIVEKHAALMGLADEKVKEMLGLVSTTGRERVSIELPPVYYEGQTLEMAMPTPPGRDSKWFMNGALVPAIADLNAISYTFKEPGEYVLTYIETETKDGKTGTVARATTCTRVAPLPPVDFEVPVNTEAEFAPPAGYDQHIWRIDGREVSTERTLKHAFHEPGVYTVECLASSPTAGAMDGFCRMRFRTTVTPKQ